MHRDADAQAYVGLLFNTTLSPLLYEEGEWELFAQNVLQGGHADEVVRAIERMPPESLRNSLAQIADAITRRSARSARQSASRSAASVLAGVRTGLTTIEVRLRGGMGGVHGTPSLVHLHV